MKLQFGAIGKNGILSSMKVKIIPVTSYLQNCSLLICEETGRAAVVDPGGDIQRILNVAAEEQVTIEKIFLTHGHLDHAGGAGELARKLDIPVHGPHRDDLFLLESFTEQSLVFGFPDCQSVTPDRWLNEGDTVTFGNIVLDVYHCPGHTPGHIVFHQPENKIATVGDVLFRGSIGRTDFPRGDHATLIQSIREKLWPLGNEVQFVPGHGPTSTFGHERKTNPYVADQR